MSFLTASTPSTTGAVTKASLLTVAVFGLLLAYRVLRALFSPLRRVPGPFLARFTRLWYFRRVNNEDFHNDNIRLHKELGPIFRYAPDHYSIDDPASVKLIYGLNTPFIKSKWYIASGNPDPHIRNLFTERDPKIHAGLRRKVANLYSTSTLLRMEDTVASCIGTFMDRCIEMAASGKPVNMTHWFQCYAFDVIGAITVAKPFGLLERGEDKHGIFTALNDYLKYSATIGVYSGLHPYLSAVTAMIGSSGFAHIIRFTLEQIQARARVSPNDKDSDEDGDDFLNKLTKMHTRDPEKFTFQDVLSACLTNVGAGSDTTSISLSAVLFYLVSTPVALLKLREEIDPLFENDSNVQFSQLQKLPYLSACIKEAMRLHPATGLPLERVVPEGGAEIAGVHIPQGSVVGINTWVAHRNTSVFGSDAETFRPERWTESTKEAVSAMDTYYMPFGLGSRTCIGKNISLLEMTKLIPLLVHRFDFQLVSPGQPLKTSNNWFVKQMDFECTLQVRKGRRDSKVL